MTFYRIQDAARPVEQLLDPEAQWSTSYNDGSERHGVSVCDSVEELAAYLAQTGIPFEDSWVLVEVDGPESDDEDEDAHLGCSLILPTEIVSVSTLEDSFFDLINAAFDAAA